MLPKVAACFNNARAASVADNKLVAFPAQLAALTLLQKLTISNNSK